MFIDRAGIPFILIALGLALAAGWGGGRAWAVPFLVLAAFFVFFFRDPNRTTPAGPGLVVSPADGRVMIAGDAPGPGAPEGEWRQISIFLSPLDVHVNRTPVEGKVKHVEFHPGKFLPAYKVEAGQLNEWTEVWFERDGRPIVCRQIVGVLARRIVCRLKTGDTVARGQRFGVMKFGSRIDLFVPPDARIRVKPGDRVVAGETVLATVP
ncbi:MAG: phosphatidylserine decarboxylase [Vicinamibacterales bacterium]